MSEHSLENKNVEDRTLSTNLARVTIPVTPFQQNCSLIWSQATKIGALIDPGGDLDLIKKSIKEQDVRIEKILLTHAHLDHAGGAKVLATELSIPIEGPHFEDKFWLEAMPEQSSRFGFPLTNTFMPDKWLEDGDKITFSDQTLEGPTLPRPHSRSCSVFPRIFGCIRGRCSFYGVHRKDRLS